MKNESKGFPVDVGEAAKRLGVSTYTVRAWIRQRRLAHYKLGSRVLLDSGDIERYIQSCRVMARDE